MQFIFGLASTTKAMSSSSSRHLTAITIKTKTLSLTINITIMPITILTIFAKLRKYSKYLCVWDKMICENFATVVPTSSSGNKPVLLDRIKSWLVDFIVKNKLIVKNMFCMVHLQQHANIHSPHWRRPKLRWLRVRLHQDSRVPPPLDPEQAT